MNFNQTITADGVHKLGEKPVDVLVIWAYDTFTLDGATVTLGVLRDSTAPDTSSSYDTFETFTIAPQDQITLGGEVCALIVSSAGASTSLPIKAKSLYRNTI